MGRPGCRLPERPTAAGGAEPNRMTPVTYEVSVTVITASRTNVMTVTSLATSSLVRPTGLTSR